MTESIRQESERLLELLASEEIYEEAAEEDERLREQASERVETRLGAAERALRYEGH